MRTRKGSKTALVLAAAGSLVLSAATARAAEISVGSTTVRPNETGSITVSLTVDTGETAVGTLTDIGFEAGASIPARPAGVAALAADVTADATEIPLGDAGDLQAFGTVTIDDEMIAYGEIRGDSLVAGGCVGGPSGIACIEDSECGGGTCEPSGRAQGGTTAASHTMNTEVGIPAAPDCEMSSALGALNKDAVFSFLPEGCTPETDCDTVRGIVIALNNLDQFPEGDTNLFTCEIVAGETQATFPLVCADGQVSDSPDGSGLIPSTCEDGEVVVSDAVPSCVGDCNGNGTVTPGELLTGLDIQLGQTDLSACLAMDGNGNGVVTPGELLTGLDNQLFGCP